MAQQDKSVPQTVKRLTERKSDEPITLGRVVISRQGSDIAVTVNDANRQGAGASASGTADAPTVDRPSFQPSAGEQADASL